MNLNLKPLSAEKPTAKSWYEKFTANEHGMAMAGGGAVLALSIPGVRGDGDGGLCHFTPAEARRMAKAIRDCAGIQDKGHGGVVAATVRREQNGEISFYFTETGRRRVASLSPEEAVAFAGDIENSVVQMTEFCQERGLPIAETNQDPILDRVKVVETLLAEATAKIEALHDALDNEYWNDDIHEILIGLNAASASLTRPVGEDVSMEDLFGDEED